MNRGWVDMNLSRSGCVLWRQGGCVVLESHDLASLVDHTLGRLGGIQLSILALH
jgi:hypothetical protein